MRVCLAFCLIATVLTVSARPPNVEEVRSDTITIGKTYVYGYETQITNGIPSRALEYSGLRLKCKVHLLVEGTQAKPTYIIQMKDVQLHTLNSRVAQVPSWFLDTNLFQPLSDSSLRQEMITNLDLPIRFSWPQSLDSVAIQIDKEDPAWSVNIKKGLIQLFRVDLRRSHVANSGQDSSYTREMMEETTAGVCQVRTVVQRGEAVDRTAVRVEKTVDYQRCDRWAGEKSMPAYWTMPAMTFCARCWHDKKDIVDISHRMSQNLRHTDNQPNMVFVENATSSAYFTLMPFKNLADGSVQTLAVQRLTYLLTQDSSTVSTTEPSSPAPEGLRLLVPEERIQSNPRLYASFVGEVVKRTQVAADRFGEIPYRTREMLPELHEMIHYLRKLELADLTDWIYLRNKFAGVKMTTEKKNEIVRHMIDILPTIGTRESLLVISNLVRTIMNQEDQQDLIVNLLTNDPARLGQIFRLVALTPRVHKEAFVHMVRLVSDAAFRQRFLRPGGGEGVFEAAWLAVGAMGNTYFVQELDAVPIWMVKQTEPKSLDAETRRLFVEAVKELVTGETIYKFLGVKVMANAGMMEFFPTLSHLIRQDPDLEIKVEATRALLKPSQRLSPGFLRVVSDSHYRAALRQQRNSLLDELLTILGDDKLPVELRITAYRVIIENRPEKTVLSLVYELVGRQKKTALRDYVLSHLEQLSQRSGGVCSWSLKWNIRNLLSSVRQPIAFPDLVRNMELPLWSSRYQMGAQLSTDSIFADDDFSHRSSHVTLDAELFGRSFPLIELGVRHEGLDKVVQMLQSPQDVGKMSSWKKMIEMLQLSTSPDAIKVQGYINILGNCLFFYRLDLQSSFPQLSSLLTLVPRNLDHQLTLLQDINFQHPTPNGFFFFADASYLTTLRLTGQPQEFRFHSHNHLILHAGVYSSTLSACVHSTTSVNLTPNAIRARFVLPDQDSINSEMSLLQFQWQPMQANQVTFFRFDHQVVARTIEKVSLGEKGFKYIVKNLPMTNSPAIRPTTANYLFQSLRELGINVKAQASYLTKPWLKEAHSCSLFGPYSLNLVATPMDGQKGDGWMTLALELKDYEFNSKFEEYITRYFIRPFSVEIKDTNEQTVFRNRFTYTVEAIRKVKFVNFIERMFGTEMKQISLEALVEFPKHLEFPRLGDNLQLDKLVDETRQWSLFVQAIEPRSKAVFREISWKAKSILTGASEERIREYVEVVIPKVYRRCLKEAEISKENSADRFYTPSCLSLQRYLNQLLNLDISYKVDPTGFTYKILDTVRRFAESKLFTKQSLEGFYEFYRTEKPRSTQPMAQDLTKVDVNFRLKISDRNPTRWNVELDFPNTSDKFEMVPAPFRPYFIDNFRMTKRCEVRGSHMRSFDGQVHSLPLDLQRQIAKNNCPILLAKDCSKEGQFEIFLQYNSNEGKKLVIVVGGKRIEVVKSSSWQPTISIDGMVLKQTTDQVELPEDLKHLLDIFVMTENKLYRLYIRQLQLVVWFGKEDLKHISVYPQGFLGKTCGVCAGDDTQMVDPEESLFLKQSANYIKSMIVSDNSKQCASISQDSSSSRTCRLSVQNRNAALKTFQGQVIDKLLHESLLEKLQRSNCPLVLLKSLDNSYKVLLNRHMDLIVELEDGSKIQVVLNKEKKLRVTFKNEELPTQSDLKSGAVTVINTPEKVTIRMKKDNVEIIRTAVDIFVQISREGKVSGICEDNDQETSNKPIRFTKLYTDDSSSHCWKLNREIRMCTIYKDSFTPFPFGKGTASKITYMTKELKQRINKYGCPGVIFSTNKPVLQFATIQHKTQNSAEIVIRIENVEIKVVQRKDIIEFEPQTKTTASNIVIKVTQEQDAAVIRVSNGLQMSIAPSTIQVSLPGTIDERDIDGFCHPQIKEKYTRNPLAVLDWVILRQINSAALTTPEIKQCLSLHLDLNTDIRREATLSPTCFVWKSRDTQESQLFPFYTTEMLPIYRKDVVQQLTASKCPVVLTEIRTSGGDVEVTMERKMEDFVMTVVGRSSVKMVKKMDKITVFVEDEEMQMREMTTKDGELTMMNTYVQYRISDDSMIEFGKSPISDELIQITVPEKSTFTGLCQKDLPKKSVKDLLVQFFSKRSADSICKAKLMQ